MKAFIRVHARRSWRYASIAAICALLYNAIMIGLDRLGVHYAISQAASAIILLPTGYLLQGRFTFGADRSWKDFFRYSAALMTNYPVAIVTFWILCDLLSLDMAWASPVATVVTFLWNYMTSSWAFSLRNSHFQNGNYA